MTNEGEEHFGARLRRLREDQEMHVPDLAKARWVDRDRDSPA